MVDNIKDSFSCPYCGVVTNPKALICEKCNHDISVAVITKRILENSSRHLAIKALLELDNGKFFNNYTALNHALKEDDSVIIDGISNSDAVLIKNVLQDFKVTSSIKPSGLIRSHAFENQETEMNPPRKSRSIVDFAVLVLTIGLGILIYLNYTGRKERESAVPASEQTEKERSADFAAPNEKHEGSKIKTNINLLVSATVLIKSGNSTGSGFMVREDGYIITNYHVLKDPSDIIVQLENGQTYEAELLKVRNDVDLSLLKIKARDLPTLKIGDARDIKRGDDVWTIGAPKQLAFSVTKGIVSYAGRMINGIYYIQSDVAINPGNSGGPMISESGEVVGINTFMITQSQGLNFALPINYAYSGTDPLLFGITDTKSDDPALDTAPKSQRDINAIFQDSPKPKRSPDTSKEDAQRYLSSIQNLKDDYDRVNDIYQREREILASDKSRLKKRYEEDSGKLSISEETQISKRLQQIEIRLITKDIEILRNRQNYYDKVKRLLKESMIFMKDQTSLNRIRSDLEKIESESREIEKELPMLQEKLSEENDKVY